MEQMEVGLSPFELLLTGFLEAVLEAFVEEKFDSECPHCQRMLNLPTSEDIEAWLKGEK